MNDTNDTEVVQEQNNPENPLASRTKLAEVPEEIADMKDDGSLLSDLEGDFENLSMGTKTPKKTPSKTPKKTPKKTPSAPDAVARNLSNYWDDVEVRTILDFFCQRGTLQNPHITVVDTDFPEQHRIFDITKVEIEHRNYDYTGYHIRLAPDLPHFDSWNIYVPDYDTYPWLEALFGRILIVKGPSRSYWLGDSETYHKKIACAASKKAHEAVEAAIKDDANRQISHHVMVWKKGTVLDNTILSEDNFEVAKNHNGMKLEKNHDDNPYDRNIYGMTNYWTIVEKGGKRVRSKKTKVNAKALLD